MSANRVVESLAGRWPVVVVGTGLALALQSGGCWCVPPEPERFNAFPSGGPASLQDYCRAWADTECPAVQRCHPAEFAAVGGDAGCSLVQDRRCNEELAPWVGAVTVGRAAYDPLLARGCLEVRADLACDQPDPSPCDQFLTGAVTAGQPCGQDIECARGLFCSGGPDSCGLCVQRAGEGGACWGPTSCQNHLRCVEGLCQATLSTGALCAADPGRCPEGTVCAGAYPPLASCVLPGLVGADCTTVPCSAGLTCVTTVTGQTCSRPLDQGEPCDPLGELTAACDGAG